jgi:hypothetical protein
MLPAEWNRPRESLMCELAAASCRSTSRLCQTVSSADWDAGSCPDPSACALLCTEACFEDRLQTERSPSAVHSASLLVRNGIRPHESLRCRA